MRRLLALMLALAFAACGGSASPSSDEAGAPGGDEPTFADIVASGKLATYKVSYRMTATSGGAGDTIEQTWYFRPPDTRLDFAATEAGATRGRISIFFLASGTFMCTADGRESSCFELSGDAADAQNVGFDIQDSFRNDPAAFDATLRETRTIAGQQAFCYLVRDPAVVVFTEGTFCYTRTGVPLLLQWDSSEGSVTMEATAFSTSVPDSDFMLPATPIRYP